MSSTLSKAHQATTRFLKRQYTVYQSYDQIQLMLYLTEAIKQ